MPLLGELMLAGKLSQGIAARNRADAPIYVDGPGLTGMIGAQARQHVIGDFHDPCDLDVCNIGTVLQ